MVSSRAPCRISIGTSFTARKLSTCVIAACQGLPGDSASGRYGAATVAALPNTSKQPSAMAGNCSSPSTVRKSPYFSAGNRLRMPGSVEIT